MNLIPDLQRVQFHLTNKCNLRCLFCRARNVKIRKELSDEKWLDITRELCEFKPKQLTISGGGEPLIRKNLATKVMEMVKACDIEGALITNGTLVTSDFAKKLVEIGWNEYRISLHCSSSKMDKYLRGKENAFSLTLDGIKKINYFKKMSRSVLPKTEIWMVLTRYNYMEIEKMIKLAKRFGIDAISLKMVNEPSNEEKKFSLSIEQLKWLKNSFPKFLELANKYEVQLKTLFSFNDLFPKKKVKVNKKNKKKIKKIKCLIPFRELVIFADGRVSPCCNFFYFKKDEFPIENIVNKSLKEVWFGETFNKLRNSILEGNLIKNCRECPVDLKYTERDYR